MELLTGILLGFLGSFHCIGMCGPLVLALPSGNSFLIKRLLHNTGRVFTYAMFGLVFGLAGSRLYLAGLQQIVSISLGGIILISIFLPYKIKYRVLESTGLNKIIFKLKQGISKLYNTGSLKSVFGIGVLNGFLPCGFVYVALTGAIVVGNAYNSALFMIMFGLGTIPAMIAVSFAGKLITINFRDRLKKLIPAFTLIIAILFILRGLNLGIPYISPKLSLTNASEEKICH
jgi:uncharacterized protein